MACVFPNSSTSDTTTGTSRTRAFVIAFTSITRSITEVVDEFSDAVSEFAEAIKRRPPPAPYVEPPVGAWHQRAAGQLHGGRPGGAPLARGKLLRWPSLKERRQAWGLA